LKSLKALQGGGAVARRRKATVARGVHQHIRARLEKSMRGRVNLRPARRLGRSGARTRLLRTGRFGDAPLQREKDQRDADDAFEKKTQHESPEPRRSTRAVAADVLFSRGQVAHS
jgi:hypothetical protein